MTPVPIGPKRREMLAPVGVWSMEGLVPRGFVDTGAFDPSLNLCWGLERVLAGTHWSDIPVERKDQLRAEVDAAMRADDR